MARVKSKELLTESDGKKVCHIILDIKGSNISYLPGDSVAIIPQNDKDEVEKILLYLKASGEEKINNTSLKNFLFKEANIAKLPASLCTNNKYHLWDFLKENPKSLEIVKELHHIRPRLYSIASTCSETQEEIHIIVVLVTYETNKIIRRGVASNFLCNVIKENDLIPIYIQRTRHFHLPEKDKDIIMVATGTGIAPFFAFLKERLFTKASGKNILFFGEKYKANLYFAFFLNGLEKEGFLKFFPALSRETPKKYVQDKILEQKKEIFHLLEHGATLYLCGSAEKMAKSVHDTLLQIIKEEMHLDENGAEEYLKALVLQKRYLKEVY